MAREMPLAKLPAKLRGGYGAMKRLIIKRPAFTSLPESLMWPNPEVTLGVMFSTGLLQCASAVLGAWVAGYATRDGSLALALVTIFLVLGAYAHQAHHLMVFFQLHDDACWNEAEPPESKEEIDDPILALLVNFSFGYITPIPREQGSFECPEEDEEEPARTERALARFFSWRSSFRAFKHVRAGDAMAELPTWLGDAAGTKKGVWYLFSMVAQQLVMATLLGILYSFVWTTTVSTLGSEP